MALRTNILRAAINTPTSRGWSLPVLGKSSPGAGKTSVSSQCATLFGIPYEILSLAERGEAAAGVVPVPEDGYLVSPPPGWVKKFNGTMNKKESRGLLIVDEVTSVAPALQPPLLGLILRGVIGEHVFGPGVRILGLCNPVSQAAYGQELAPAVANRFVHLPWETPSVAELSTFLLGIDVHGSTVGTKQELDIVEEEERIKREWRGGAWSEAVTAVTGFLNAQPEYQQRCPEEGDPAASGPWPSCRTWEYTARALASSKCHSLTELETDLFVEGCVGHDAATALMQYRRKLDLPNLADLLDGKETFEHRAGRVDRTAAVLAGSAALVTPRSAEKRSSRGSTMWSLMSRLVDEKVALDLLVPAAIALLKAGVVTDTARPVMKTMKVFLKAAGIDVGEE